MLTSQTGKRPVLCVCLLLPICFSGERPPPTPHHKIQDQKKRVKIKIKRSMRWRAWSGVTRDARARRRPLTRRALTSPPPRPSPPTNALKQVPRVGLRLTNSGLQGVQCTYNKERRAREGPNTHARTPNQLQHDPRPHSNAHTTQRKRAPVRPSIRGDHPSHAAQIHLSSARVV